MTELVTAGSTESPPRTEAVPVTDGAGRRDGTPGRDGGSRWTARGTHGWSGLRWSLGRRVVVLAAGLALALAGAGTLAAVAVSSLNSALNDQTARIDPARVAAEDLIESLSGQQANVDAYVATASPPLKTAYAADGRAELGAARQLHTLLSGKPQLLRSLDTVLTNAATWQTATAAGVFAKTAPQRTAAATIRTDDTRFSVVARAFKTFSAQLTAAYTSATGQVQGATRTLVILLIVAGALIAGAVAASVASLRRWVTRPILALRDDVRVVVGGALDHEIATQGPPEISRVASDVEEMRRRIVEELDRLRAAQDEIARQAEELQRSNADLEQFAYVASHDLQEPLRKVASFCELLERRYRDQLDDRGKQYVDLAADGAKRMQHLIRDVLALARIGRAQHKMVQIDTADALRQAMENLSEQIDATGATVTHENLPTIIGDPTLVTALFQNLVANSVKFRSEDPPVINVWATPEDDHWRFSVQDNGIGIEPQYGDRVFIIFQRLHGRDEYTGTGIGLALCRRIVEFHGGRIWLGTSAARGTTIEWSWPSAIAVGTGGNDG